MTAGTNRKFNPMNVYGIQNLLRKMGVIISEFKFEGFCVAMGFRSIDDGEEFVYLLDQAGCENQGYCVKTNSVNYVPGPFYLDESEEAVAVRRPSIDPVATIDHDLADEILSTMLSDIPPAIEIDEVGQITPTSPVCPVAAHLAAGRPSHERMALLGETVIIARHSWTNVRNEWGGAMGAYEVWVSDRHSYRGHTYAVHYQVDGGRVATLGTFADREMALGVMDDLVRVRGRQFAKRAGG